MVSDPWLRGLVVGKSRADLEPMPKRTLRRDRFLASQLALKLVNENETATYAEEALEAFQPCYGSFCPTT
jgi:hypothetical protein